MIIAAGIFSYGIVIGHYHLFPFRPIQRLMWAILPEAPHHDLAAKQPDPHWARMVSQFNGLPGKPDVVMVGDSLTEEAEWQEFFPEVRIANRGIAGDTAAGVLARIDEIKQRNPRLVFVMIGVNDFFRGRSVDDVFADYVRIVEDLNGGGTTVVVQSTLYVTEDAAQKYPLLQPGRAAVVNARVSDLDRRLKDYCSKSHAAYLDLNHTLAPGGTLDLGITNDGIHLSVQGYAIWVGQIRRWMKG